MSMRAFQVLLVTGLVSGVLWGASDPFVGNWKLNSSKSRLPDQMKVERADGNKYTFDFGLGAETILADGTDQPGYAGTTLSVTVGAPDRWTVVRTKDGHRLLTANWTLSRDGNTLSDDFTSVTSSGSTSNVLYVYRRTAGTSGFTGTWESTSAQVKSGYGLRIQPYQGDGLSFIDSTYEMTKSIKFDGKDYPVVSPNVPKGYVAAGRRVNERVLELSNKLNGKVTSTQQINLSPDLKTLTVTTQPAGPGKPTILVYDRD